MGLWRTLWATASVVVVALLSSGCRPATTSAEEEEQRDPYYVDGEVKKRAMDYAGAAEAFEKALQNNPRSAAVHAELGLLYHEKLNQPIPALDHLDRYLQLKPDSNKSDAIRLHITACKQDLVRDVPMGSLSSQVQAELEKLIRSNTFLLQETDRLRAQLAQVAARSPLAGPIGSPQVDPGALSTGPAYLSTTSAPPAAAVARMGTDAASPEPRSNRPATGKTHVVKSGENPSSIARLYGITANALLAANPGVDARRLRVGQSLNVPSRQ